MDFNTDSMTVESGVGLNGQHTTLVTPKSDLNMAAAYTIKNVVVSREEYFDWVENADAFEKGDVFDLPPLPLDPIEAEKILQQRTCGGDRLNLCTDFDL